MNGHDTDVAIVGSGPNALSLAAHLRRLGVSFRIFGPPMKFWRDMPRGLNLKSFAFATNVYVPEPRTSFPEWCRARGLDDFDLCPMETFAAYGMHMVGRFVGDLEPVEVSEVAPASGADGGFALRLASGARFRARRVVMATGLTQLAHVPPPLARLPRPLGVHTADLSDYSMFRGRDVAVVGAGASAIEAGALVHEAGGRAEILVRGGEVVFHERFDGKRSLLERLRAPLSVLGPGKKSRLLEELPFAFYYLPEAQRLRFLEKFMGPSAPWWITERVRGVVPISLKTTVTTAEPTGGRVRLALRVGEGRTRTMEVDHVVFGTGFAPDVGRVTVLHETLRQRLRRVARAPWLSPYFESSIRGLYFVGPLAAPCFGPLFRFVCGAKYAAPTVARHLARSADVQVSVTAA